MARPTKNNCDYFSHDRDMRNHKKIKAIRSKFGIQGYAIWVMLLEFLTGNEGNILEKTDLEYELIAGDFGVTVTEMSDVIDYCIRLELLIHNDGFISSKSLDERLAPVYEKRSKAKGNSNQQYRTNGKFVKNNTDSNGISVTETPQSKVNKSKVNETKKEKERKKDSLFPSFENLSEEELLLFNNIAAIACFNISASNEIVTKGINYMFGFISRCREKEGGVSYQLKNLSCFERYAVEDGIQIPTNVDTMCNKLLATEWDKKLKQPEKQLENSRLSESLGTTDLAYWKAVYSNKN